MKNDLYDKINNSDAKEVKKAINEKFGVINFRNTSYISKVQTLCSRVYDAASTRDVVVPEISNDIKFALVTEDFSDTVDWLKILNVYVTTDPNFMLATRGDSIVTNLEDKLFANYYQKTRSYYFKASIFICISGKSKHQILEILHHEMAHLFDATHESNGDGYDAAYGLTNDDPLFIPNAIWTKKDLDDISINDIHAFLSYCLYYANITERHAYTETINFQLVNTVSDAIYWRIRQSADSYVEISNRCSPTLEEYHWLYKNLELLIENEDLDQLIEYSKTKKFADIKAITKCKNIKAVLQRLHNNIKHVYDNGIKLFNYYMQLYRKYDAVKLNKRPINESVTEKLRIFSYKVPNRFRQ